jgi:NADP-dependent 3-hydroxy acid dehydrogenase YdfG
MADRVALVTGVGPDNGSAICRRFSRAGYRVAMLARTSERLAALEAELHGSKGYTCDVTDIAMLEVTVRRIQEEFGHPSVFIHNAVDGGLASYDQLSLERFQSMFDVNVKSLLRLAQLVVPAMKAAGSGAIVVTGNTAAMRGGPNHAGFAPTKAAQRILSESLARKLGPDGIHVAYLVIDAAIDMPRMRERYPDKGDDFFITAHSIAEQIWHIAHQPRDAWSFLCEIRPFGERW